jgi:DNA polymerase-1
MIEKNCEKIASKFDEEVLAVVLIDGDGNFRNRLATIKPYKGTRSVQAKPLMYNDIRQYLLDAWDAGVVYGQETDDEMAIRQTIDVADGFKSVIVAVDKDMLQVPGWHLNPNKGFKNIGKKEAVYRQYAQCITGDATDNIGGAYKCGPAAAKRYLADCTTEAEMWDATVKAYRDSIEKHGDQYGGLGAVPAATENMRLIYLRRNYDAPPWTPPGA